MLRAKTEHAGSCLVEGVKVGLPIAIIKAVSTHVTALYRLWEVGAG